MNQLVESLREITGLSPYGYAVRVAGLALAYFLAARVGLEYAVTNPVISTVWPASGIALAAVLLGALRLLPAVFIGAFALNYSIHGAIIAAIIAMAHGLDVRVTAEGVETKGQMEALRKPGCDEFQGYLLSKPLPTGEFAAHFLAPARKKVRKAAASALARASRGRARRA
jgi:EAL domain